MQLCESEIASLKHAHEAAVEAEAVQKDLAMLEDRLVVCKEVHLQVSVRPDHGASVCSLSHVHVRPLPAQASMERLREELKDLQRQKDEALARDAPLLVRAGDEQGKSRGGVRSMG